MKTDISASILGCNLANLQNEISKAQQAGVDMIHYDVMDGVFVNNISFGVPVLASVRKVTSLPLDVHLMILNPLKYIEAFAKAGADLITFHAESESDIGETIDAIHSYGKKAGLSIKPDTPLDVVMKYIEKLDMVLIMTVEPGFGGQGFISHTLDKISALRKFVEEHRLKTDIQVDGGINDKTAPIVRGAGANNLVSGSYLFGAADIRRAVQSLIEA